jgi:hypothetical protein
LYKIINFQFIDLVGEVEGKFKSSNKANNENQRIIRKERQIVKLFLINCLSFLMENAMLLVYKECDDS